MNILIVGSGAREHAIARSIKKSMIPNKLYCLASNRNPGIEDISEILEIGKISDPKAILEELVNMGKEDHPVAIKITDGLNMEFPLSMIYVDKNYEKLDGYISAGGWPQCNKYNGWGPGNRISSDCFNIHSL